MLGRGRSNAIWLTAGQDSHHIDGEELDEELDDIGQLGRGWENKLAVPMLLFACHLHVTNTSLPPHNVTNMSLSPHIQVLSIGRVQARGSTHARPERPAGEEGCPEKEIPVVYPINSSTFFLTNKLLQLVYPMN